MIQRPTGVDMPVYAALSTMRQQPTQDEIANGVIPLDTLPANWWNWLWNTITKAQNDLQYNDEVIFTEINNVLAAGGIQPNPTADAQATHDQLIRAINVIKNAVATTTTLGVVKSSDTGTDGSVRVNTGGTMTVNGFGDLATLHTVDKSTITGAINEVHDEMDALNNDLTQEIQTEAAEIRGEIGTLSSLTTSAKGSTVAAINELQSEVNTNKTSIGTLSSLTTSAKGSTVAAINELQSEVNTNKTSIGTLSSLTTSAKGSTVAAINELQSEVNTRLAFHTTTMKDGGFVSSTGGYISLQAFWTKMVEEFGLRAEVSFTWANATAGYVSLDGTAGTDRVYINGATVIYNCNSLPNKTYAVFQALVIPGGGITDTYVMMANVANVAGTLSLKRITRLANASEVGALSSLTTTAKSSIVAAINELQSEVNTVAGELQNIGISMPIIVDGVRTTGSAGAAIRAGLYSVTTAFSSGTGNDVVPASMYGYIRNGWLSISRIASETTVAIATIDLDIAVFATAPIASGNYNIVRFTCFVLNTGSTYRVLTDIMSNTFRDMNEYYAESDQLVGSCSIKDLWFTDANGRYISVGCVGTVKGFDRAVTYQTGTPTGAEIVRAGVLLGITYRVPLVGIP